MENFIEKNSYSRMLKRLVWSIVIILLNSKISILNPIGIPIGLYLGLNHTLIGQLLRPNWASIALQLGLNCEPTFAPKSSYRWLSACYELSHFERFLVRGQSQSQKSPFSVLKNRLFVSIYLQSSSVPKFNLCWIFNFFW
jgi:hypothetical protein